MEENFKTRHVLKYLERIFVMNNVNDDIILSYIPDLVDSSALHPEKTA